MRTLFQAALACLFASVISNAAIADAKTDQLLAKIDADISAKRLSSPASNNAIDKIWQFKSIAPYDQRINSRVYKVGAIYVDLANKSIESKNFSQAQLYLDNVWMVAYLTPGLEDTQDTLDKVFSGSANVAKAKPAPKPAPKPIAVTVAKQDDSKAKAAQAKKEQAQKEKQLAAARVAKEKAEQEAAQRRRSAEEKERKLAQLRKEEQTKREAAAKLATLNAQREKANAAAKAIKSTEETAKAIADFNLDQELIDGRETREIRTALLPICQEIIDNEASVVLHTRTTQDYRWLTVRLTLCVRRIDKNFRLRHSHQQVADQTPSISLHPGRSMSLLKKIRS
ncbi:MAG: colicin import membrane protein [Oceanicoccus sp.]|jgi:colicin import membrane protein